MKETGGSSDIALQPLSNKLWEPENKGTEGALPNAFRSNDIVSWSHLGTGFKAVHAVRINSSGDPMNIAARLICFRILEQLPDDAIVEAQEALESVRVFYQQPVVIEQPKLPLPTRNAIVLPTVKSVDYPWDNEEV